MNNASKKELALLREDAEMMIARLTSMAARLRELEAEAAEPVDDKPFGKIDWLMEQMPQFSRDQIYELARTDRLPGLLPRKPGEHLIVNKARFRAGLMGCSVTELNLTHLLKNGSTDMA